MQYTLLVYETNRGFAGRTDPHEKDDYWRGTFAFLAELRQAGELLGGAGLQTPDRALHLQAAPSLVREGPLTEGAWQLGGYFTIEAADTDAALAWARRFPQRPGTAVELRPNLVREGLERP